MAARCVKLVKRHGFAVRLFERRLSLLKQTQLYSHTVDFIRYAGRAAQAKAFAHFRRVRAFF